jgi:sulfoxide reductase heme-binding subunit YedZ
MGYNPEMRRAFQSVFLFYLVMLIPSYELVSDLIWGDKYYARMMHVSGVISTYLLVLSLAITPITLLIKRWSWGIRLSRWLLLRRRYFGLGSFYYACLHLIHYLREINDIENVFYEAFDFELAIAWIALLILTLLAITSNNASARLLKAKWKQLHLLAYPGTALIFAHWLLFDFFPDQALNWLAAAIAIKSIHFGVRLYRKNI